MPAPRHNPCASRLCLHLGHGAGHAVDDLGEDVRAGGEVQPGVPCAAGSKWSWDGVSFEFLHPRAEAPADRAVRANNQSCVLRIEGGGARVLLTGDIERAAERELLLRAPALLPADALIVPHHGSATSSTPEFVKQVAPRHAVFAVGYRNRFGHPREEVLARYRDAGSELLRTDAAGAIQLRFAPGEVRVDGERDRARRYWHES